MQIGYMRVSKADGSQSTDLQRDALRAAGVATRRLYQDRASAASMHDPDLTLR
jgi:DNA invertase Pin-like site-specific DNA recombinase